jgi:hypothetical protein
LYSKILGMQCIQCIHGRHATDIRRQSKSDKLSIDNIKIGVEFIQDPTIIAQCFNDYFIDKPLQLSAEINKTNMSYEFSTFTNVNSIRLYETDEQEVLSIIKSLNSSNTYDVYELSTHIIKSVAQFIAQPLAHVFNESIKEGTFPSNLKMGKVLPIFKAKDNFKIENYRPISILLIISKV